MSEYTLSNSAAVIDSAITRVASADTEPTANSQNMVTSGGVKAYVDGEVTALEGKISGQSSFSVVDEQSAGYQVFDSGLKMAWGLCSPIAKVEFPTGVNFTVPPTVTTAANKVDAKTYRWTSTVGNVTTTDFEFTGNYGLGGGARYIAIGH